MVTARPPDLRRRAAGVAVVLAVATIVAAVAPLAVVLGALRLAAVATMGLGAWWVVGRLGAIDLSVGAAVGAGGIVGGVVAGELGLPAVALLPVACLAGAVVAAVSGALAGHLGRAAGALASLAVGIGALGLARTVEVVGGRSGYHAVPLLVGGDRTDLVVAVVVVVVAWWLLLDAAKGRFAARAAVAVAAPPVAAALGRHGAVDAARAALPGGLVLGAGGLLAAAASGSVAVDGHGPDLTAILVLDALVAGALAALLRRVGGARASGPTAALLAVALLHGPGVVWPLVPLVGTAPVLLVMGPVGLGLVAAARHWAPSPPGEPIDLDRIQVPGPLERRSIRARGLAVPAGTAALEAVPGEVVALVGPNGVGKSTVLARLGGQLPDGGGVELGGVAAPSGPVARARQGVARAWQQPPDVAPSDLVLATGAHWPPGWQPDDHPVLGGDPAVRAAAVLAAVVARRPAVLLLDEPAALLDAAAVARLLRRMADAGTAVVVVEHRPEVVTVADRRVELHRRSPDRAVAP